MCVSGGRDPASLCFCCCCVIEVRSSLRSTATISCSEVLCSYLKVCKARVQPAVTRQAEVETASDVGEWGAKRCLFQAGRARTCVNKTDAKVVR